MTSDDTQTWRVGDRVHVRGTLGTIRSLSQTTPCVTSVDVQLDDDGWLVTSPDELELVDVAR